MEEGFALEEFSFYKQNCFNIFPQNLKKKISNYGLFKPINFLVWYVYLLAVLLLQTEFQIN